ncbi:MAG: DNA alkylation repair protein [Bacteroidia bacterium]|nr:DNA alkylation repair protein [Bacteroidia bacterium]
MAKKLKDYYDMKFARDLADKILAVYPAFGEQAFIEHYENNFTDKEFLQRQDVAVDALDKSLSEDYTENIHVFHRILGEELTQTEGMFTDGWWLWPIGRYVEKHGTKNLRVSLDFIKELTKRHTGEFAIRPLLMQFPKETVSEMLTWSVHESVHVRRLSGEGMRIRLPWAKKIYVCLDEFDSYKQILTNLKNDLSKFVQKSVGNNLNDLMKERPEKAMEIIAEWQKNNPTKQTLWIIKHGMRSERKKK